MIVRFQKTVPAYFFFTRDSPIEEERAESSVCVQKRRCKTFMSGAFSSAQRSEESAPFQWGYHEVRADPSYTG